MSLLDLTLSTFFSGFDHDNCCLYMLLQMALFVPESGDALSIWNELKQITFSSSSYASQGTRRIIPRGALETNYRL